MAIESQYVTAGQVGTAEQFNDLVRDTWENHDHSPGKGGVVSHATLIDGAIDGYAHAELNSHVQGAGTNADPDAIGGSMGVHGLAAAASVLGIMNDGYIIQLGTGVTNTTLPVDGDGLDDVDNAVTIAFSAAFSAAPTVVICPITSNAWLIMVQNVTANGFTARLGWGNSSGTAVSFYWMAIGPQ